MAGSDNKSDDASVHNEATNTQQQPNIQPQIITTVSNNNAKFPYLKKDEYEKESKERTTLLRSIPDDHVADFHYMDDARDIWNAIKARDIWNAIKARFGGNAKSKKMRKSMLKQEFSEFIIGEAEGLHKGYDMMQKILSQLNQLKAKPDAEDINLKFLRALPSSWSQFKMPEADVKGYNTFSSSQSAGPSHYAFLSATKKQLAYKDLEQIEKLDLEEMDLKWQMAMLSIVLQAVLLRTGKVNIPPVRPQPVPTATEDEGIFDSGCSRSMTENQLNKKVKAIRCKNGTEFKNAHMIDLCGSKGIKREYSNPEPHSKMRVSVNSPHNKTPNALLTGNIPSVSHFKPFGCHVTILNTSDHLGKFDRKADEGYIVGYSASYKHVQANQSAGTQGATTNSAGTQAADSDSDCDEQVIIFPSYPPHSIQRSEPKDTSVPPGCLPVPPGKVPVPTGSLPVPIGSIPIPAAATKVPTDDVPVPTSSSTDSMFDDEPTARFSCLSDLGNHAPSPGIFSSSSYDDEFGAALNNVA
nr:hypothetical protein [Tanacetum cinerariifolium]